MGTLKFLKASHGDELPYLFNTSLSIGEAMRIRLRAPLHMRVGRPVLHPRIDAPSYRSRLHRVHAAARTALGENALPFRRAQVSPLGGAAGAR